MITKYFLRGDYMLVVIYKNGDIYVGQKEFYLDSKNNTIQVGDKTTDLSDVSTVIAGDRTIYGDTMEAF